MNIKTTSKLLIVVIAFILSIMLLGTLNNVNAVNTTTIKYNANGGYFPTSKGVAVNQKVKKLNFTGKITLFKPEKEDGSEFLGWSTTPNGEVEYESGKKYEDLEGNCTLYAVWEETEEIVTLTYCNNSGEKILNSVTANKGEVILDYLPTSKNYEFKGWSTTKGGSKVEYNLNDTLEIEEDITLYSIWKKKEVVAQEIIDEEEIEEYYEEEYYEEDDSEEENDNAQIYEMFEKILSGDTDGVTSLILQGMSYLDSETLQNIFQNMFGGILGNLTGNNENIVSGIYNLFANKEEVEESEEVVEEEIEESEEVEEELEEEVIEEQEETENEEVEEKVEEANTARAKVLFEELDQTEDGTKINSYVIKLAEDFEIEMENAKIIINNKCPIYVMQKEDAAIAAIGIEEKDEYTLDEIKANLSENLYMTREGKIYKKINDEYVEIAKFTSEIEGIKEGEYYQFEVQNLALEITNEDLDKLLSEAKENTVEVNANVETNTNTETETNTNIETETNTNTVTESSSSSGSLFSNLFSGGIGSTIKTFVEPITSVLGIGSEDSTGSSGLVGGILSKAKEVIEGVTGSSSGGLLQTLGDGIGKLFGL